MEIKEKKLLRINEKPYFLLNNYSIEAEINFEQNILDTEHKQNVLFTKVHWLEIFLIKFFPYLFFLFLMYRFPQNIMEIFITLGSILFIYALKTISKFFSEFFTKVIIAILVVALISIVLKIDGSFKYVNYFIISAVSNFILILFIEEYLKYGVTHYYKLLNIRKEGKINLTRKKLVKKFKIPFTQKYLLRKNMGFDSSISYSLDGFYFKIMDEEDSKNV